jgi:hypothetical protein
LKDREKLFGLMVISILANGNILLIMVKELKYMQQGMYTKDSGRMTKSMDKGCWFKNPERSMKACGKRIRSMGMESAISKMQLIKGIGSMMNKMDLECYRLKMECIMKALGEEASSMVMES